MSSDNTKHQEFSSKTMTRSQPTTQNTTDENTPSGETAPTTFNTTALISETQPEPPGRYMPDKVLHSLLDAAGSIAHSAELASDSYRVQATAATDMNDGELIENGNRPFSGGQTADEQNVEADLCPAPVPRQGHMLCHTRQTLTLR